MDEVRQVARPGRAQEAEDAYRRAVSFLADDDPEQAALAAGAAKRLAARSSVVREVLGMALYQSGRFREALAELQAYRRISGRLDQNHLIADAHRATGSPEKAVTAVREALADPLPAQTHAELIVVGAAALADMGRFQEALALLRSVPQDQDAGSDHALRVWYVTGDVLERSGQGEEAAEQFRRVLRYAPEAFDAQERLAALEG